MTANNEIVTSRLREVVYNPENFEGFIVESELTIPMVQRVGQVKSAQTVLRIVCSDVFRPVVEIHETEEGKVCGDPVKLLGTVTEEEAVCDQDNIMPGIVAGGFLVYRHFSKSERRYKNYSIPGRVNDEGRVFYTPYPKTA